MWCVPVSIHWVKLLGQHYFFLITPDWDFWNLLFIDGRLLLSSQLVNQPRVLTKVYEEWCGRVWAWYKMLCCGAIKRYYTVHVNCMALSLLKVMPSPFCKMTVRIVWVSFTLTTSVFDACCMYLISTENIRTLRKCVTHSRTRGAHHLLSFEDAPKDWQGFQPLYVMCWIYSDLKLHESSFVRLVWILWKVG